MKILAIGAHFDDVELGCGGSLLKHRDKGDEIYIIVVTNSGYTSATKGLYRKAEEAKSEGEKSAKFLGAKLICCDKEPITLVATEKLVLEIEEIVSRINPDRVYTHQPNDFHADHAVVGYVSMRACRKCDEVLLYRSNWYIMGNSQEDNYYVNISEYIDKKVELLRLFESEMKNVNYSWIDFVKKQNSSDGAKVNVSYAETFRIAKMFWK
ncbi:MAG: PIG-L family deacetylase [Candidatus Omnitrophica bacterium]|nr:PIG-L family deacetylase [Candidatus Omnitrophota bacterium]MDD5352668.1 PIG-L family deacetylase [Candidatus Omnitrophota bacterium]MDD5550267.1 PIG-L family deacetylase [Candidatus Omnitrophota bacterium]